MDQV
jgi:ElaB/YqjD/DUF883 family membrane-anchored ribosome-binding protein